MKDNNKSQKQLLEELAKQKSENIKLKSMLSLKVKQDGTGFSGEELFRNFFEYSPDYCYMVSKSGELLNINKAALKMLEYNKKEILGKPLLPLIYTPDSQKKARLLFGNWKKTGNLSNEELILKTKSGKERTVLLRANTIYDNNGKPVSTISIQRDITERKQVEKIIKESESHLRELYQKAPMVYQSLDIHAHFLEINDAWVKKMEYSRDDIIGTWFGELLAPGQQNKFKKIFKKFKESGKVEGIEYELIKKNGSKIIVSFSGQISTDRHGQFLRTHCIMHDITERKQAMEKIKDAEEQLRTAFDQAAIGMVLVSPEGSFKKVNTYFENFIGYTEIKLQKMTFQDITHPEDYAIGSEIVKSLLEGEIDSGAIEKRYIHKSGRVLFVHITTALVRKNNGEPLHFFSQIKDITERKKSEIEIKKSEERFKLFFKNIPGAVFVTRIGRENAGQILDVNPAAEIQTGYSRKELLGMNILTDLQSESFAGFLVEDREGQLTKEDALQFNEKKRRKDGSEYWSEVLITKLDIENESIALSVNRDITDRLRTEEKLRKSEEKLCNIFENTTNVFYSHTTDHVLTYLSPQIEQILGYTPEEAKINWTELASDNPANQKGFELTEKAIKTGKAQLPYELELVHKNGKKVCVEVREAPIVVDGVTVEMVGALTDITERKQAEVQLVKVQAETKKIHDIYHSAIENTNGVPYKLQYKNFEYEFIGSNVKNMLGLEAAGLTSTKMKEMVKKVVITDPDFAEKNDIRAYSFAYRNGKIRQYNADIKFELLTGEEKWISDCAIPIKNEEGSKVVASLGILQDITQRKLSEQNLANKERYYRSMLNQLHEDVMVIDHDYIITDINNSMLVTTGINREKVIGKTCYEISHGYDKPCDQKGETCPLLEIFRTGKSVSSLHEHVLDDGSKAWLDLLFSPLFNDDGKVTKVIESIRDVTKLYKMQDALKESEHLYRDLVEKSEIAILTDDIDGNFIYFNNQFLKIFGYNRKEIKKQTHSTLIHPEDLKMVQTYHSNRIKGLSTPRHYEARGIKKDGSDIYLSFDVVEIDNGKITGTRSYIQDITEQKEAEEKVKFLSDITKQANTSIITTDPNFKITWVNDAFKKLYGYEFKEIIGNSPDLLNAETLSTEIQKEIYETVSAGNIYKSEALNIKKDGSKFLCDFEVFPITDEGGEVIAYSGHQTDITERKLAERALTESENKFKQLTNNSLAGIYIVVDQKMKYCNKRFAEMWGYKNPDEIIGSDIQHLFDSESISEVREELNQRISGDKNISHYEAKCIKKNGELFYIEVLGSSIVIDGKRAAQGMAVDISSRKHAEETIRKLSAGIEQSPVSIVITDLNGTIEYVNPNFTKITGYTREEITGKNPSILQSGEHTTQFYKKMWDKLSNGETWRGEFHNKSKNGELFWEDATIGPITNELGEITHYISLKEDITDRRKLEEQLLQSQKLDSIGQLAGGVAHDFNNLLTVINGYSGLLMEKIDNEKLKKELNQIQHAGEKAASLTQQLLAFSRKELIQPSVLDINNVVNETEKMLKRLIGEDINLNCVLDEEVGYIKADVGQLNQILMNLTINARDAMPTGGILTIETKSVVLDESYSELHLDAIPGKYVMLSVSDNGIGMTEDIKLKIFEPFFTTKAVGKGTGLGLSTVYGIVKQNNGYIWVYSELRKGTTFKVYLPLLEEENNITVSEFKDINIKGGSETILIVEDDIAVKKIVTEMLHSHGYNVLEAEDGIKAIEITKENKFDLLLTDLIMPGISGTALATEIEKLRPKIKVLYISGYTDDIVARHGILNKELPFIQKPFSKEKLLRMVRETLDKD